MPQPPADLRRGRIIWATVRDRNGFSKSRPAIILTATAEISADQPLEVIAITTSFPSPAPSNCVELPWHPEGKARTRLRQRSAAVLDWLVEIKTSEVTQLRGDVPPLTMLEILRKLKERSE